MVQYGNQVTGTLHRFFPVQSVVGTFNQDLLIHLCYCQFVYRFRQNKIAQYRRSVSPCYDFAMLAENPSNCECFQLYLSTWHIPFDRYNEFWCESERTTQTASKKLVMSTQLQFQSVVCERNVKRLRQWNKMGTVGTATRFTCWSFEMLLIPAQVTVRDSNTGIHNRIP